MLSPKRTKFRKAQRRLLKSKGDAHKGNLVSFGDYGLMSVDNGYLTSRQIEAARIAMTRYIKRGGKVWIRIFPDRPYTRKPAETRMGKGKGAPEKWISMIKPGTVMFEMAGVDPKTAKRAMELAASKLPVKCKFVLKDNLSGVV